MKQYLDLCKKTMTYGIRKTNRTGIDHIGYTGDMMKFNLADGFPAVTTKKRRQQNTRRNKVLQMQWNMGGLRQRIQSTA